MGKMGRPINSIMIIDNSPHSYAFNPENAVPCESWFDDMNDRELLEFIPVLQEIAKVDNVITELEERKMNGYSALMGLNNSGSDENSSEYYSTTESRSSVTDSSWASNSGATQPGNTSTDSSGSSSGSYTDSIGSSSDSGTDTGSGTNSTGSGSDSDGSSSILDSNERS
jgi:hypothetical protein